MKRRKKKMIKRTMATRSIYRIKNVEFEHTRNDLFTCSYDIEVSTQIFLFSENKWAKPHKHLVGIFYMAGKESDYLITHTPNKMLSVDEEEMKLFWDHLSYAKRRLKQTAKKLGFLTV